MEVFKLERVSYYEYYSGKSIKVYAYDGHGNQTDVRQVQVRFKYEYNGSKWVLNPYNPDHSPYNQLYYSEDGNISFNTLDKYKKEFEKEEEIQTYRFFIRYAPVNSDDYYPAVEMRFAFSGVFVCNGKRYFAQSYSFIDITKDNKESIAPNIRFFDFLKCKDNSYIEVGRDMTGDELLQYKTAIVSIDKLYKTKGVNLPVYPGFFLSKLKTAGSNNILCNFSLTIPDALNKNNVYYENTSFSKGLSGFESISYRVQGLSLIGPQNKSSFALTASDSSKNGNYCFDKKLSSSLNFKGFKGSYSNCLPIYLPNETNGNPDFDLLVKDDSVEINGTTVFRAANGFTIKNLIIGERNLIDFTNLFSFENDKKKSSNNFYPLATVDYNKNPDSFGYYETIYTKPEQRNWNIASSNFQDISLDYSFTRVPAKNLASKQLFSLLRLYYSGNIIDEETLKLLKSEWFDTYKATSSSGIKTFALEPKWESYTPPQMSGTLQQRYSIEYFYKNTQPTFKLTPMCFSSMPNYDGQNTNVQYLQYNIQTNQIISASDDKAYFPGSRKERNIVILSAPEPYDEGPNTTCVMLTNKKDGENYYGCGFISINASNEWANTKVFTNPEDPSDFDYFNDPSLLNSGHPNKNNTPKIVFVELEKTE